MTNSPEGDFLPSESTPQIPSQTTNKVLFIVLGLGCGSLALLTILGIIAAIALPSFLNQATEAQESEARTYLSAMNRGQQAHYLEFGEFAESSEALGLSLPPESERYSYAIIPQSDPTTSVYMTATPKEDGLAAMSSAVFFSEDFTFGSVAILCESDGPNPTPPAMPLFDVPSSVATCPPGSLEQ